MEEKNWDGAISSLTQVIEACPADTKLLVRAHLLRGFALDLNGRRSRSSSQLSSRAHAAQFRKFAWKSQALFEGTLSGSLLNPTDVLERKDDLETCPPTVSNRAHAVHFPSQIHDSSLNNGQSQSGSFRLGRKEGVENLLPDARRNTRPFILDPNRDLCCGTLTSVLA